MIINHMISIGDEIRDDGSRIEVHNHHVGNEVLWLLYYGKVDAHNKVNLDGAYAMM